MTTTCCPPAPLALRQPPLQRWLGRLRYAWDTWRAQSARQAEWQALEHLSDRTRRDLGLAERAPQAPSRALWDIERGTW